MKAPTVIMRADFLSLNKMMSCDIPKFEHKKNHAMSSAEMHAFLGKHTSKAQVNRLVAELVCALGVSDADACSETLFTLCAERIYKHKASIAPQDFITGADPWPEIKTACNPYVSTLSDKTLYSRTNAVKKVHEALGSTRPLHWLADVLLSSARRTRPSVRNRRSRSPHSPSASCARPRASPR